MVNKYIQNGRLIVDDGFLQKRVISDLAEALKYGVNLLRINYQAVKPRNLEGLFELE